MTYDIYQATLTNHLQKLERKPPRKSNKKELINVRHWNTLFIVKLHNPGYVGNLFLYKISFLNHASVKTKQFSFNIKLEILVEIMNYDSMNF